MIRFLSLMALMFLSLQSLAQATLGPVSFKGDFRFRTENIKEEQAAPLSDSERTRNRIRLRLGAAAPVNSSTEVIARFATGSTLGSEGNTTNQDLTDYYSKKTIVIDLAYFNWKPSDNLTVWGGKTPLVFQFVGGNDLIFDTDLTPEGLSLKYKTAFDRQELSVNTSATWLSERFSAAGTTDNSDVGLSSAQLGYGYKGEGFSALVTAAAYHFSNVKGATPAAAKGNTLVGGVYANNYKLAAAGLELSSQVSDIPVALYTEQVSNSEGGDYKKAAIYGLKLGKLKDAGSWSFTLDHREIEKDAVLGVLTESDSSGGGADIRSLRAVVAYQVDVNMNVALNYFTGKRLISSTTFSPDYQRGMLDFNFIF